MRSTSTQRLRVCRGAAAMRPLSTASRVRAAQEASQAVARSAAAGLEALAFDAGSHRPKPENPATALPTFPLGTKSSERSAGTDPAGCLVLGGPR